MTYIHEYMSFRCHLDVIYTRKTKQLISKLEAELRARQYTF